MLIVVNNNKAMIALLQFTLSLGIFCQCLFAKKHMLITTKISP